jgi:HAD superfamily hydrolase (TIGR01549 family)
VAKNTAKAIVFDLFDTIVTWNPEGLPIANWRGREVRSTTPILEPILAQELGEAFDRDRFMQAHYDVYQEIFTARAAHDPREITCRERFERTLLLMGLDAERANSLSHLLRSAHMARVRAVTSAPAPRVEAVRNLSPHFRLGLLSNFDDGETGHHIVRDTGLYELFDTVVISAEHGLRKPHRDIFIGTLERMNIDPRDAIYVGDTPRDDVMGARSAGMGAVWINRRGEELPDGIPAPDIVITDLSELPARLGVD